MSELDIAAEEHEAVGPDDLINENQFLLEYVHAVLASDPPPDEVEFHEAKCAELFELGRELRQKALFYAMATSADTKDGAFGPDTAEIEYRAKSTWVLLRGNRYQVLEGEIRIPSATRWWRSARRSAARRRSSKPGARTSATRR